MEGLKRVRLSVLPEIPNSGYERVFHKASVQSPKMDLPYVAPCLKNDLWENVYFNHRNKLKDDEDMFVLTNFIIFNNWRKVWKI